MEGKEKGIGDGGEEKERGKGRAGRGEFGVASNF